MNSHFSPLSAPKMVRLSVEDFLMLKKAGVFDDFSKSELLEGELFGVPRQPQDELESDASIRIKLRTEDYALLEQAGALESYGRTELIDGVVYQVSPQYSEHMKAKVRLLRRLADACDALESGLEAWSEGAVDMAPSSMPKPDIFITSMTPVSGPVRKETVVLIVEISHTASAFDLDDKAALYAANGVPEYWVVDLKAGVVHQMWSPDGGIYAETREVPFGEPIAPRTIPGISLETTSL